MTTYRVRDKDWATIWGENLTQEEAHKLKERVVGSGKSRTARVEPMSVRPPGEELDELVDAISPAEQGGVVYELADTDPHSVQLAGVIVRTPPGTALRVNGVERPTPTKVAPGDVIQALIIDPELARAKEAALAAARKSVQRRTRPAPPDVTVRPNNPRTGPVPMDRTVSKGATFVRLGAAPVAEPKAPPSPLKVAMMPDPLAPVGEDILGDDDLGELAADLGGIESAADVAHAQRQRDVR